MEKQDFGGAAVQDTLFGFIWRFSKRHQVVILLITCFSFPLVYMSLEVPKWIINDAIQGTNFPVEVLGYSFEQIPYLLFLSCLFILLIVANNGVKFVLNMYKGIVGERMLRRLRHQLYEAVLRFRPRSFRQVSGDQLIPMITAEVEDLGGFISEAIATPAFQGGTLLVYLGFIFTQNLWLGLVAVSLYPFQAWIIPHLQGKVSLLARDRVRNVRVMSSQIGETVNAAAAIHSHDTSRYQTAEFNDRLHLNYSIRLNIYKKKYLIKFLNNFLNQMPPFFFYAIGGYFVIEGDLTVGALVAAISAYQDISGPWKELLNYYQSYSMTAIKYQTIVESFRPDDTYDDSRLTRDVALPDLTTKRSLLVEGLSVAGLPGQEKQLKSLDLELEPGQSLALVGGEEDGGPAAIQALAGLLSAAGGSAQLGDIDLLHAPEAVSGRVVSYLSPNDHIFDDTIRANVAYALKHRAIGEPQLDRKSADFRLKEALASGSTTEELTAPWDDLEAAGVADGKALDRRIVALLSRLGLADDLYRYGLQAHVDPAQAPDFVKRILEARKAVAARIEADANLQRLIALWRRDEINPQASLGQNIVFGAARRRPPRYRELVDSEAFQEVLAEARLTDDLVAIGLETAKTLSKLFEEAGNDADLVARRSPITREELADLIARIPRLDHARQTPMGAKTRERLIALALHLRPAHHSAHKLDDDLLERCLKARDLVLTRKERFADLIDFFGPDHFLTMADVEHNLIGGMVNTQRNRAREKLQDLIRDITDECQLTERIIRAGLTFKAGSDGSNLRRRERRAVRIARALVKRPQLLLIQTGQGVDEAEATLVAEEMAEGIVVAACDENAGAGGFQVLYRMKEGRAIEALPSQSGHAAALELAEGSGKSGEERGKGAIGPWT